MKQIIHVLGWYGHKEQEAEVIGLFAIHTSVELPKGFFRVTHIPSGTYVPLPPMKEAQALALAKALNKAKKVFTFQTLKQAERRKVRIIKAIREALDEVADSKDLKLYTEAMTKKRGLK